MHQSTWAESNEYVQAEPGILMKQDSTMRTYVAIGTWETTVHGLIKGKHLINVK